MTEAHRSKGVSLRAYFLSRRLDVRALQPRPRLSALPLTVKAGESGYVVIFRYGVLVFVDTTIVEAEQFLAETRSMVVNPFPVPVTDEVVLQVDTSKREGPEEGCIFVHEMTLERYQLVAEVLAKSLVLEHYETRIAQEFDQIEPLAISLRDKGRYGPGGRDLLKIIGGTLLSLQYMVGRVEVSEKPELLWDLPELERFYGVLTDEYEINERHIALERKMQLISRTAETVLALLQARRSLRVEWYIVILIVVEIFLTLYNMFLGG